MFKVHPDESAGVKYINYIQHIENTTNGLFIIILHENIWRIYIITVELALEIFNIICSELFMRGSFYILLI